MRLRLWEKVHLTGFDVIDGSDNLDGARLDAFLEDGLHAVEDVDASIDVGLGDEGNGIPRFALGGLDGGFEGLEEGVNPSRGMAAADRCGDSATFGVAENDDQVGVKVFDGVFDTADSLVGDDVAGDADDEEIADALIEEEFGGNPGIGTTEDDGERVLTFGDFGSTDGGLIGVGERVFDVALVPFNQALESLVGGDAGGLGFGCRGWHRWFRGLRKGGDGGDREAGDEDDPAGGGEKRAHGREGLNRHPVTWDWMARRCALEKLSERRLLSLPPHRAPD